MKIDFKDCPFKDVINLKLDNLSSKVDEILVHVTKTNGRVNSLEKWKYAIGGGIGFMGFDKIGIILERFF